MDGISLLVGGTLGILAGWAFSSASFKQRDASRKQEQAVSDEFGSSVHILYPLCDALWRVMRCE